MSVPAGRVPSPTTAARPPDTRDPSLRVREFVTPEGIDLQLTLADAGERAAAFLLDVAIIAVLLIVFSLLSVGAALLAGLRTGEFVGIIWLLGAFALRNFYFMAFELTPRAATPGKRILGLRVATRSGRPLTADAIFARNAMRELEVFLPLSFIAVQGGGIDSWIAIMGIVWCGVFVFFPLFNRDRLRVGDLVAGTWVVRAPKRILDADLVAREQSAGFAFTLQQLDAYGIKELSVLEEVLRRKEPSTMATVAQRIRAKIGAAAIVATDEEFLSVYYAGLRGRLESRLLFGRRRKDKYDKA
jgi:uncharacterized RDD family membrane protein YckC